MAAKHQLLAEEISAKHKLSSTEYAAFITGATSILLFLSSTFDEEQLLETVDRLLIKHPGIKNALAEFTERATMPPVLLH